MKEITFKVEKEEEKPFTPTSTHFLMLNKMTHAQKYSLRAIEKQFGFPEMIEFLNKDANTPLDIATILAEISWYMLDYKLACTWEQPLGYNKCLLINIKNGYEK